jgi:hypothetical protein
MSSEVNPLGGGAGLHGYITDPPSAPGPGDRLLSDPPAPPGPGDRFLSDPPAPPVGGDHFLSDPLPPSQVESHTQPEPTPPSQRLITDPPVRGPGERFITDPPVRGPGERFITDPPLAPGPGDRFLSSAAGPADPPIARPEPTAGDHAMRSLNNVGNFFGDLWDKKYGEAALDAGQAVMDAGSAFHALLFGEDEKTKPPVK